MATSPRPLNALFVEDSENDVLLLVRQLRSAGFAVRYARVDTEATLDRALKRDQWDVVLSDFALPGFSMWKALEMTHASDQDLPFIIVSGVINEENATHAMRSGAHDYVLKDQLGRLAPALQRELAEAAVRRDRMQISKKLRTTEIRTQAILDSSADAIIGIDIDGTILSFNRTGEEMLGYRPAEALGQPVTMLMPEPHRSGHGRYIARFLSSGEQRGMGPERELTALHKSGKQVPIAVTVRRLEESDTPVFIATIKDISERRRLEQESKRLAARLQQAEKLEALGTMAGSIAHDFANFLAPIGIQAHVLCQERLDEDLRRQSAGDIVKGIERAQALVKQILTFATPQRAEHARVNLCTIVADAVYLYGEILRGVPIRARIPEDPIWVMGTESQLHQALMNLTTNAQRAVEPGGGHIEVELQQAELDASDERLSPALLPGRYAMLRVSDTGMGIAADVLARIFEPFFTTQVGQEGTGLGLAIVHSISRAHQGTIDVESRPGEGSSFLLTLPVVPPPL